MVSRALTSFIVALAAFAGLAHATNIYCSACTGATPNPPAQFLTDTSAFTMTILTFAGDPSGVTAFTDQGVTFTAGVPNALQIFPSVSGWTGNVLRSTAGASLTITLPTGTTAFGFNFGDFGTNNAPFTLTADSNGPYTLTAINTGSTFFGFVGTAPITSIVITSDFFSPSFELNGFTFGSGASESSDTPEAPGFLMTGGGLLLLQKLWRRRTRPPS